jgi:SAM-dependent methyltransferase
MPMPPLETTWSTFSAEMIRRGRYESLTVTNRSMFTILRALVPERHSGLVLDVGAGSLAFKALLAARFDRYIACDLGYNPACPVDMVADARRMPLKAGCADWVFLSAVLEHCPNPADLLTELNRLLKPGGRLLLSAPHFHHLHGEPHDYYRFTRFGLNHLMGSAGFRVTSIVPVGGLIGFMSTLLSTGFWAVIGGCRWLWGGAYHLHRGWVALTYHMDRMIDTSRKFALGYLALGEKR